MWTESVNMKSVVFLISVQISPRCLPVISRLSINLLVTGKTFAVNFRLGLTSVVIFTRRQVATYISAYHH